MVEMRWGGMVVGCFEFGRTVWFGLWGEIFMADYEYVCVFCMHLHEREPWTDDRSALSLINLSINGHLQYATSNNRSDPPVSSRIIHQQSFILDLPMPMPTRPHQSNHSFILSVRWSSYKISAYQPRMHCWFSECWWLHRINGYILDYQPTIASRFENVMRYFSPAS